MRSEVGETRTPARGGEGSGDRSSSSKGSEERQKPRQRARGRRRAHSPFAWLSGSKPSHSGAWFEAGARDLAGGESGLAVSAVPGCPDKASACVCGCLKGAGSSAHGLRPPPFALVRSRCRFALFHSAACPPACLSSLSPPSGSAEWLLPAQLLFTSRTAVEEGSARQPSPFRAEGGGTAPRAETGAPSAASSPLVMPSPPFWIFPGLQLLPQEVEISTELPPLLPLALLLPSFSRPRLGSHRQTSSCLCETAAPVDNTGGIRASAKRPQTEPRIGTGICFNSDKW